MRLNIHRVFNVYWRPCSWQGFTPEEDEFVCSFETEREAENFVEKLKIRDKEKGIVRFATPIIISKDVTVEELD